PGDLHRGHPSPARAQVTAPPLRRVQGAPVGGPGLRADRGSGATPGNAPDRDAAAELLAGHAGGEDKPEGLGDSAYGSAATRAGREAQGFTVPAKCPPARNAAGRFPKDRFTVELAAGTVTYPAGQTATIVPAARGGRASFRPWCATCPLRPVCTASRR